MKERLAQFASAPAALPAAVAGGAVSAASAALSRYETLWSDGVAPSADIAEAKAVCAGFSSEAIAEAAAANFDASPALQREFVSKDIYVAFAKADIAGNVRILRGPRHQPATATRDEFSSDEAFHAYERAQARGGVSFRPER